MHKELIRQMLIRELSLLDYHLKYYNKCIDHFWKGSDVDQKDNAEVKYNFEMLNIYKNKKKYVKSKAAKIRQSLKWIKGM